MKFQWDINKATKVLEERGIDFDDAAIAMGEGPVLISPSPKNGEDRDVGLVEIRGKIWAVVHIWREDAVRIITVRRARPREERAYRELHPRRIEGAEEQN